MNTERPTPETDGAEWPVEMVHQESNYESWVLTDFARQLERQRNIAREQRDELLAALEAIKRRVPIMGSKGDYREGQLHALEACSEVANAAIAAVKGGK